MYTPNNDCVYSKAFTGCLAGLGGGGRYLDVNAGDESAYARMADAYAQELDTVWGASTPTAIEEDAIASISFAVWRTRSPLEGSIAFIPGSYNGIVRGVIALAQEGNAQVISSGVDPNGCGGGGGASLGSNFVYQPGGTADGNVFTSWPALMKAINEVAGIRTILVDGTFVGNTPEVPSGTWHVDNVIFYGQAVDGFEALLTFDDGAKLVCETIYLESIAFISNSSTPIITVSGTDGINIVAAEAAIQSNSPAAPFIHIAGATGGVTIFAKTECLFGDGVTSFLQVDAPASIELNLASHSALFANATSGTGAISVTFDAELQLTTPQSAGATLSTNAQGKFVSYTPAVLANWSGTAPTSVANALDRIAAKIGPIP